MPSHFRLSYLNHLHARPFFCLKIGFFSKIVENSFLARLKPIESAMNRASQGALLVSAFRAGMHSPTPATFPTLRSGTNKSAQGNPPWVLDASPWGSFVCDRHSLTFGVQKPVTELFACLFLRLCAFARAIPVSTSRCRVVKRRIGL
jgi:hypothetical protein